MLLRQRELHQAPRARDVAVGADRDQRRVDDAVLQLGRELVAGLDGHLVEKAIDGGVIQVALQVARDLEPDLVAFGVAQEQPQRRRAALARSPVPRAMREQAAGLQQDILQDHLAGARVTQ